MPLVGYARVSTTDQNPELQIEALKREGCTKVFSEQVSAKTADRPQLQELLRYLREGDTLVVTRLDRLARSQTDLFRILSQLQDEGVEFRCTEQPQANTEGPMGKLLLGVLGAVAEFENELRKERQAEGIAKAKAEGKYTGGHSTSPQKVAKLYELLDEGFSVSAASRATGISRPTAYKYRSQRSLGS